MRSGVSYALTVIGAVLLLVGGISLYLREEIVDEDAFAQRSTAVLEDDAVRHAVARELAAEVSNSGPPQLVSARPILEGVFEALIGTQPFEQVFDQAARQANKLMFTRERTVVVTLKDAVTVLRSALEGANPKLAKQIPKDVEPELAKLSDSGFATQALQFADDVRLFGILFPLLALVAFAAGIALAPDRRSGVTRTGLAIGIDGVFLVVVLTALKAYLVSHLEGDILTQDELRAAASAIWDGFFGDLQGWATAVGIAGLVLAAASSSLLEPTDVTDRAERLHRRLTTEPETTRGRVFRALAILALGIFVVVSPTLALQTVAVLIGAYMLFWGTSELLTVVQPPRGAAEEMRREAKRRIAIGAGIAVGAIIAIVLLVGVVGGDEEEAVGAIDPDSIEECNGSADLCDRRLNDVTFAGTHNSMSAADSPGWLATNQRHDIAKQLKDGIRVLLIDPHYGIVSGDDVRTDLVKEGTDRNRIAKQIGEAGLAAAERLVGQLGGTSVEGERVPYLCHSVCELGATEMVAALTDVRRFLERNRHEVVIIFIEPSIMPDEIAGAFQDAGLYPYLATLQRYEPLPTLREMIASNRRLVVFTERDGGTPDWYHEGFSFTQDTEVGAELDKCEGRNGNAASPLLMVNHWVDGFPAPVEANEAVTTMKALLERAKTCKRELGRIPNLFPVDFYDSGDIVEAVAKLNQLSVDAGRGTGGSKQGSGADASKGAGNKGGNGRE
jgi:Short repeat of unknown function (DUF308)